MQRKFYKKTLMIGDNLSGLSINKGILIRIKESQGEYHKKKKAQVKPSISSWLQGCVQKDLLAFMV